MVTIEKIFLYFGRKIHKTASLFCPEDGKAKQKTLDKKGARDYNVCINLKGDYQL